MVNSQNWQCALELNSERKPSSGSAAALSAAIGRGADLRIYTEFRHNQHIGVASANDELIEEVSEFDGAMEIAPGTLVGGIIALGDNRTTDGKQFGLKALRQQNGVVRAGNPLPRQDCRGRLGSFAMTTASSIAFPLQPDAYLVHQRAKRLSH